MSVNGDLVVIRNGRSTSQVSVYNYPEHLNPFYEDDNHKRLRFWKINKNAKDGDGQGRRNSFSLGGLKDMWAFKSFRMKKKSSTLGINKTSESPPPLRRDIIAHENGYNTYDPRMRYTTGATNGLGGDNAFPRNAPYRSSLQDMRYSQEPPINGIAFNRNDRYRSTIQTATTSGTSSSSPTQSLTLPTPRRSSQASVASTNPFDDDDDEDVVMGGSSASSTPSKHPARKKRRAPPPPVPMHQIIKEESSSAGSTPSHKTSTTHERNITAQEDERLEIQNLTAEIESFVKSSNSDSTERETRCSTSTTTGATRKDVTKSSKQNGTVPKGQTSPIRKSSKPVNTDVDIVITHDAEPLFIREDQDIEVKIEKDSPVKVVEKQVRSPPAKEIGHIEAIHVHVESPRSSPEKSEPSKPMSTFRSEVKQQSSEKSRKCSSPEKIITSSTVEIVEIHKSAEKPVEELKIKETPEKPPIAAKPNIPKSPKLTGTRLEASYPLETPDTPAMRRREIKIEADLPSTPESNHKEIGTEFTSKPIPAAKPQEVTVKIERITTTIEDSVTIRDQPPIPAVREHRPSSMGKVSPSPVARKLVTTENEVNLSTTQEPKALPTIKKIDVEEKISNLDTVVPTTVSDLQLKISESAENIPRVEELTSNSPVVAKDSLQETSPSQPSVASTSNAVAAHTAPFEKPPRAKHFAEEIPETIYRPRPWKQSTLAPLEPVPPEKRRSVKQIIESINRSQRLLNGKKEDETEIDASQRNLGETNTNAMEQNLKSLAESQREMKRMLEELEGLENAHERKLSNKSDENFQGILDTIVSTLARETAKKKEPEIFKKCTITKEVNNASRESSPTSSNLDWNPVPKPKRTKNLSPELQAKKNNNNDNNNNNN